jgi:hypothetical protein
LIVQESLPARATHSTALHTILWYYRKKDRKQNNNESVTTCFPIRAV